ncbi:MAG: hypothetical protein H7Y15_05565 [Pseudonocardia sp.]|nr:hypothetical protein [Pseudonocardia sp.]
MTAIVRGAFEYQGQKCSAALRIDLADSLWQAIRQPTSPTPPVASASTSSIAPRPTP